MILSKETIKFTSYPSSSALKVGPNHVKGAEILNTKGLSASVSLWLYESLKSDLKHGFFFQTMLIILT